MTESGLIVIIYKIVAEGGRSMNLAKSFVREVLLGISFRVEQPWPQACGKTRRWPFAISTRRNADNGASSLR